jgi:hypothetical protein
MQYFTPSAVENATSLPSFEQFWIELEGMPITPTHKMHSISSDIFNIVHIIVNFVVVVINHLSNRHRCQHSFLSFPSNQSVRFVVARAVFSQCPLPWRAWVQVVYENSAT